MFDNMTGDDHMNIDSKHKPGKYLALVAALMALVFTLASCSTGSKTTAKTDTTSSTSASSQVTTESATTAKPETTATTAALSATEQKYIAKIKDYLVQLPAEKPGTAASADVQTKLVSQMTKLYAQKASSKDIYTLYLQGIKQLSPDKADMFTACAISGMRRNSFEDYTTLEKLASQSGFLDRFFEEAKLVDFKYVKLNQDPQAIDDKEIRTLVENAKAQGYYIASSEGMLYNLVDFTAFAKYRQYNSKPMAALIETLAIDALDPMTSDAAFLIDLDTLAARTYNMGKLLEDYQGTRYEQYMVARFKDHMTMLFYGVNNNPVFNYQDNTIDPKSQVLFKDIQNLEGTRMADLIRQFSALVEANGGKMDDATREKGNQLLASIQSSFKLTDDEMAGYSDWMSGTWHA